MGSTMDDTELMPDVRMPELADLAGFAPLLPRQVTGDDMDLNGHMNATHLLAVLIRGLRAALDEAGVDGEYVAHRRMGTFAAEHNIRYLGELRLGERLSVRVRLLDRTAKTVHAAAFLVNETAGRVATVLEVVSVHVDQETRRAIAMPDDIAAAVDARIAEGNRAGWRLPARLALRR